MTEVLVGPTFTKELDVSAAAAAYVMDLTGSGAAPSSSAPAAAEDSKKVVPSCLFLKDEETGSDDFSGSSSSSIGAPGDSEDDDDNDNEEEVSSSKRLSLDSLEDSLPIKRGLSSHFSGKSKSFVNLSEVNTVKDLEKTENLLNKRRRVLIANKLFRKSSSFYSWHNPKSMPLLTLHEDQDHHHHHDRDDHDDDDYLVAQLSRQQQQQQEEEEEEEKNLTRVSGSRLKKIGFKSQSCFSLADLHEEEYQ